MSKRRSLTPNQMLLALISCKSENDFDCLWNAFVELTAHGFISRKQWLSFYHSARYWYFDSDSGRVIPCPVDGDLF